MARFRDALILKHLARNVLECGVHGADLFDALIENQEYSLKEVGFYALKAARIFKNTAEMTGWNMPPEEVSAQLLRMAEDIRDALRDGGG